MPDRRDGFTLDYAWVTDPATLSMGPSRRWAWAALGSYVSMHGTAGDLLVEGGSEAASVLAAVLGVEPEHLFDDISQLPGTSVNVLEPARSVQVQLGFNDANLRQVYKVHFERLAHSDGPAVSLSPKSSRSQDLDPMKSRGELHTMGGSRGVIGQAVRTVQRTLRAFSPGQPEPEDPEPPAARCASCERHVDLMNRLRGVVPGRGFRAIPGARTRNLHARHREHGDAAVEVAIRKAATTFLPDPARERYFRPVTIFRPSLFEGYLTSGVKPMLTPAERLEERRRAYSSEYPSLLLQWEEVNRDRARRGQPPIERPVPPEEWEP